MDYNTQAFVAQVSQVMLKQVSYIHALVKHLSYGHKGKVSGQTEKLSQGVKQVQGLSQKG